MKSCSTGYDFRGGIERDGDLRMPQLLSAIAAKSSTIEVWSFRSEACGCVSLRV